MIMLYANKYYAHFNSEFPSAMTTGISEEDHIQEMNLFEFHKFHYWLWAVKSTFEFNLILSAKA